MSEKKLRRYLWIVGIIFVILGWWFIVIPNYEECLEKDFSKRYCITRHLTTLTQ